MGAPGNGLSPKRFFLSEMFFDVRNPKRVGGSDSPHIGDTPSGVATMNGNRERFVGTLITAHRIMTGAIFGRHSDSNNASASALADSSFGDCQDDGGREQPAPWFFGTAEARPLRRVSSTGERLRSLE